MKSLRYFLYILIILAIVSVGGYFFYNKNKTSTYVSGIIGTTKQNTNIDRDNDGLRDWEEILWKTNPDNNDTDGDGTSDGDEVKEGRDPTIKGPADKLQNNSPKTSKSPELAADLFNSYIDVKSKDGKIDEEESTKIAKNSLDRTYADNEPVPYTKKDLSIIDDNSVEAYKKYGNDLAHALGAFSSAGNEMMIFQNALQQRDESLLAGIDPIIKSYRETLSGILAIKTPSNLADVHLTFINTMNSIISDTAGMRILYTDSVLAFRSFTSYQADVSTFSNDLNKIITAIKAKGVKYSTGESGYGLINIL